MNLRIIVMRAIPIVGLLYAAAEWVRLGFAVLVP